MALITGLLPFIISALRPAFSRQLGDELKAWLPWVVERIIQRAVARLPHAQRERYEEEWQSHVNEVPGQVGKLFVAIGFLKSARKMNLIANRAHTRFTASDVFKRIFELTLSVTLLLLFAPAMLLIGLALRLDGAEAVLATETRVGLQGRKFKIYRFSAGTPRLGLLLRRLSLNELPQFINVLLGDMSLVGPRPLGPDIADRLSEAWPISSNRMAVRPGLTSMANVADDGGMVDKWGYPAGSLASHVAHDLFYIKHRSLKLDLRVLWRSLVGKWPTGS